MNFTETDEHISFVEFYRLCGLEVSDNPKSQDGAFFTIYKTDGNGIIAAATLSFRGNAYILDYIAVREDFRGKGIGEKALSIILKKAKYVGANSLFITAKNIRFFEKMGFVEGNPKGIDLNLDCKDCPQYLTKCFPKTMKYCLQNFEGEL
ncbi:MAG: GNAT family N-acetyltransferase [Clostridia bacterium]|nr:GNAT family N-acetyltransferase [Clostridia bacterium]